MEPNSLVQYAYELMRVLKEDPAARRTVQPRLSSCTTDTAKSSPSHCACSHPRRERRPSQRTFRNRALQTGAGGALMGLDSYCFVPTSPR